MLQVLFEVVSNSLTAEDKQKAYLIAFGAGVLWIVGQSARHNAFYETPIVTGKIRSELIFIIYTKLSRISQYTAKTQ